MVDAGEGVGAACEEAGVGRGGVGEEEDEEGEVEVHHGCAHAGGGGLVEV